MCAVGGAEGQGLEGGGREQRLEYLVGERGGETDRQTDTEREAGSRDS